MSRQIKLEREIRYFDMYMLHKEVHKFLEDRYGISIKAIVEKGKLGINFEGVSGDTLKGSPIVEQLQTSLLEKGYSVKTDTSKDIVYFILESEKAELELEILDLVRRRKELNKKIEELAAEGKTVEDAQAELNELNNIAREILNKRSELKSMKESKELAVGETEALKRRLPFKNIDAEFNELIKKEIEKLDFKLSEEELEIALEDFNKEQKSLKQKYTLYTLMAESKELPKEVISNLKKVITTARQKLVESSEANRILDNKFIWLFSLFSQDGEEMESYIDSLDDAIAMAVDQGAKMIVANPYIDPNPEDEDVELVFADEIGPVVVYDGETATVEKDKVRGNE